MLLPGTASVGKRARKILDDENQGELFSIHKNSVYCLTTRHQVLLIHDCRYGTIPFGIAVNDLAGYILGIPLHKGMRFIYHSSVLEIPEADFKVPLVETAGTSPEKSDPGLISIGLISLNLNYLVKKLIARDSGVGLAGLAYVFEGLFDGVIKENQPRLNPFCMLAFRHLNKFIRAFCNNNLALLRSSLEPLIGLGVGLTPSMDDVLVGFLSTLTYLKRTTGCESMAFPSLKALILASSGKTNFISEAYLHSAARGEPFTIIEEAIEGVIFGPWSELQKPLNRLLAIGHNSGTEILLGIVLALKMYCYRRGEINDQNYCSRQQVL